RPSAGRVLLGAGLVIAAVGHLASKVGADSLFGDHNYYVASPFFFMLRVGVVWAVLGSLALLTDLVPRLLDNAPGRFLQLMGQETLVIYVGHLFVLYGSPVSASIARKYKHSLGVWESTLCFFAVFGVTLVLAKLWN